jgi:endonuclease/exonuclease/phosphatase family metal-dependent hydrolase
MVVTSLIMRNLLCIFIIILLSSGCTKKNSSEINNNPDEPLKPPPDTFSIMSYNILFGAGWFEQAALARESEGYMPNSLSKVIELIKFYNPDIVGIQEAVSWQYNNDSIAKYVSNELKMNYILSPGWLPDWNAMLMTKFEIIDYELFSKEYRNGALRARLKSYSGDTLIVYNFHLRPDYEQDVMAFNNLTYNFEKTQLGIAMGDFNESPESVKFPANWILSATSSKFNGDQIWLTKDIGLSPSGKYYRINIGINSDLFELNKLSDHFPVLFKTGLYN